MYRVMEMALPLSSAWRLMKKTNKYAEYHGLPDTQGRRYTGRGIEQAITSAAPRFTRNQIGRSQWHRQGNGGSAGHGAQRL